MLVLSRTVNESIVFPDLNIEVMITDVRGGKVRIGITAPKGITVHRKEIQDRNEGKDPAPKKPKPQKVREQKQEQKQAQKPQKPINIPPQNPVRTWERKSNG